MQTYSMTTDWIGELAETAKTHDRRHRERERRLELESRAITAGSQNFWNDLTATVERDLLRFQREFDNEPGRTLVLEPLAANSFWVVRPGFPGVKLHVQMHPSGRAIEFRYNAIADDTSSTLKCCGTLDMRVDRNGQLYLNQYGRDFLNFDEVSRMFLERVFMGIAFY